MSLLSKLFKNKEKLGELSVVVIGPSKAGKTTLIRFIETNEPQINPPLTTLGIEYRQKGVRLGNWKINLIDVGGQEIYQKIFWELAVEQAQVIIYVIDSSVNPRTDNELFRKHLKQFNHTLNLLSNQSIFLILLNKQDLVDKSPIKTSEIGKLYPIKKIPTKIVSLAQTSAKFGTGIEEALDWIVSVLDDDN